MTQSSVTADEFPCSSTIRLSSIFAPDCERYGKLKSGSVLTWSTIVLVGDLNGGVR